ncbi:MAG: dihydroneopterin aldolase [Planctomycetes bacterium]|nr:dihydroneopterin aldolase [Planctomycetota bacterium]
MSPLPNDRIHIRDLALRCIIGVYPEERHAAQEVVINITLWADLARAGRSDDLADTVDYKAVKNAVVAMVEASRFQLLEALAEKVAGICLAAEGVAAAGVLVEKPGALTGARTVGVELFRRRSE